MIRAELSPRRPEAEARWGCRLRRVGFLLVVLSLLASGLLGALWFSRPVGLIQGVIWQPTGDFPVPTGCPGQIGAGELVVQWLQVDGHDLTRESQNGGGSWHPDWPEIRSLPWARRHILGLASSFDLEQARRDAQTLAAASHDLARNAPLPVAAWYAPIEISPDWRDTSAIRAYLAKMPRPLWVSIYGGYEMTDGNFLDWVEHWLPEGVGVLYQDEVGVNRQTPEWAAHWARLLISRFGRERVAVILEAFHQTPDGFEPAALSRLIRQVRAYRGLPIFVFSARHLSCRTSLQLKLADILGLL